MVLYIIRLDIFAAGTYPAEIGRLNFNFVLINVKSSLKCQNATGGWATVRVLE